MADLVPAGPPWFTKELQEALLGSARDGLKTKWVAIRHGVAPGGLRHILETGAKKGSGEPFRSFYIRWMRHRAECMEALHQRWTGGDHGAGMVLKELFPGVYGKDAEPDWDPFDAAKASADDMEQLDAILDNPAEFGLLDMFAKHKRLRPDGT